MFSPPRDKYFVNLIILLNLDFENDKFEEFPLKITQKEEERESLLYQSPVQTPFLVITFMIPFS